MHAQTPLENQIRNSLHKAVRISSMTLSEIEARAGIPDINAVLADNHKITPSDSISLCSALGLSLDAIGGIAAVQ